MIIDPEPLVDVLVVVLLVLFVVVFELVFVVEFDGWVSFVTFDEFDDCVVLAEPVELIESPVFDEPFVFVVWLDDVEFEVAVWFAWVSLWVVEFVAEPFVSLVAVWFIVLFPWVWLVLLVEFSPLVVFVLSVELVEFEVSVWLASVVEFGFILGFFPPDATKFIVLELEFEFWVVISVVCNSLRAISVE